MRGFTITGWLLLAMAGFPAGAGVELVLEDGRVLEGVSLERKDDRYLLELAADGGTMTLPVAVVREIRLSGGSEIEVAPGSGEAGADDAKPDGSKETAAETSAVDSSRETDRRPSWRSPTTGEQLSAFGRDPASFRRSPVDPRWRYEDVLGEATDVTEFRPSRWYEPPLSPTWTPDEAFEERSPVPRFSPVRWYRPPVRATWYPRDGWGSTVWFPPVVSSRDR